MTLEAYFQAFGFDIDIGMVALSRERYETPQDMEFPGECKVAPEFHWPSTVTR